MIEDVMLLSGIFGPMLIFFGVWQLFNQKKAVSLMDSLSKSPVFYIGASVNLIIGLTIVNMVDVYRWDWVLLLQVLGWLMIVRAFLTYFVPDMMKNVWQGMKKGMAFWAIVQILWGVGLCILAFS